MLTDSIEGFILVGGASRRMGTDKGRLTLDGQSFVERIATALSSISRSITLVGRSVGELGPDLPVTPDIYKEWGALGGLHGALSVCRAEWAAVVACDLPFVTTELFTRLASLRECFEAVAPLQSDGIAQPLCSLYRVIPCLERAEKLIRSGERKPIALLQSVRTRWVSFAEVAELEAADLFFDNINTPQDYARASEKER